MCKLSFKKSYIDAFSLGKHWHWLQVVYLGILYNAVNRFLRELLCLEGGGGRLICELGLRGVPTVRPKLLMGCIFVHLLTLILIMDKIRNIDTWITTSFLETLEESILALKF